MFIILRSQELLLEKELQLALYQQELLQVSSACFVCSITFYGVNHCSRNCVLPIANAMNSWLDAFIWQIFHEVASFVVTVYVTRYISREYCWIRAKDASFVSGDVTCCRCHWWKMRYLTKQKLPLLFSPLLCLLFCILRNGYHNRNSS